LLHQVGNLFELSVKLRCQKVKRQLMLPYRSARCTVNITLSRCIAGVNWDPAVLNKVYLVSDSRSLDKTCSTVRV